MTQRIKATVLACLALALTACFSSSPPARFFGLSSMPDGPGADAPDQVSVGVGPIDVPEYLRRPQLVTRGQGSEFIVHEYARWAERLDSAIPRLLATNIDALSPGVVAVAMPYTAEVGIDYRLLGRVMRFDTDAAGLAVLEIQWGLGRRGEHIGATHRSRYTATAADPEDPQAIVAALQETIDACSRDLAAAVKAEVARDP